MGAIDLIEKEGVCIIKSANDTAGEIRFVIQIVHKRVKVQSVNTYFFENEKKGSLK